MTIQADALDPERIDTLVSGIFERSRAPGGAVAIVAEGQLQFIRGYGVWDEERKRPLTQNTLFPIASTTKAINATLIGMLVEEGLLGWDDPVQKYLPDFRLADPVRTPLVTLRDCLAMRTGLPRHDWVWMQHQGERRDLVRRFAHLELTAGFRERFQYNNLGVTLSGIVAEIVTGESWESLAKRRLLDPLGMHATVFGRPAAGEVTCCWHESADRRLLPTEPMKSAPLTAPSGGSIHSTVQDMARWLAFNLAGGRIGDRRLIASEILAEIHRPQMVVGKDPTATSPNAAYGFGWFIDHYHGSARITHGGYLDDVATDIALFPEEGIGIICFTNFGPVPTVKIATAQLFELLTGRPFLVSHEEKLAEYEKKIEETRQRNQDAGRVAGTSPSHALAAYVGQYVHPGYGAIELLQQDQELLLRIGRLEVPLRHWHYDAWVAEPSDRFAIHVPHCFDLTSRYLFQTDAQGTVAAVTIPFEANGRPIRFEKVRHNATV